MKKRKYPTGAIVAAVVGVFLLLALGGYFVLISPKRSEASKLDKEIASLETQIQQNRAAAAAANHVEPIRAADLFRLTKAMPDQADMAGIVLQLSSVAKATGISFQSIAPQSSVLLTGYQVVPINLVFQGNFYDLADFLYRLKNLVGVRNGQLEATGRLFAVDSIDFAEGELKFPQIQATLTVDAFVYGTSAPATTTPPVTDTTTTATTTTTETTTTAPTETTTTAPEPTTTGPLPIPDTASAVGASN